MYKVKEASVKVLLTIHDSRKKLRERGHILSKDIKYSGKQLPTWVIFCIFIWIQMKILCI